MSTLTHDIQRKQPIRDQLASDTEEFLRRGGKIEVLDRAEDAVPAFDDEEE